MERRREEGGTHRESQGDAAHVSNADTGADCSFWVTLTSNLKPSTRKVTRLPSFILTIILQLRVRQRRAQAEQEGATCAL